MTRQYIRSTDKKRICSKCSEELDNTTDNYYSLTATQLMSQCKKCHSCSIIKKQKSTLQGRRARDARSSVRIAIKAKNSRTRDRLEMTAKRRYGQHITIDWDNWADTYQIDHCCALSKFNLEDDDENKLAKSLGNVQFLLKSDNCSKGTKVKMIEYISKEVFVFMKAKQLI